jgi:phosphatidylglycerol:prolipoprotein diacylglycerol transferase
MYPILFSSGDFVIPSWHMCFLLAALAALYSLHLMALRSPSSAGLHPGHLNTLFFWAYCGAYLGARLLSVVIEQPEIVGWWSIVLSCFTLGPLTFFGGVIGGALAAGLYGWQQRLSLYSLCDLMIPPLFLALAIGRIGCFLNGDDYGLVVPLGPAHSAPWWAVQFPSHQEAVFRYPVQLWESAAALMIFIIAYRNQGRVAAYHRPGLLGLGTLLAYCMVRFVIEFWRDDPRGWLFVPALSTSQGISLIVFLGGGILWGWRLLAPSRS